MRPILFLLFGLFLLSPVLSASNNSGGLPGVVDRVELVEKVVFAENVGRVQRVYNQSLMNVGSTDYLYNDSGKLFIQLSTDGLPEKNATCFGYSWFPNSSVFFSGEFMAHLDQGIYFHDFIVPNTSGVYPVSVTCTFQTIESKYLPESISIGSGDKTSGDFTELYAIDGNSLVITETVGSSRVFSFNTTFVDVQSDNEITLMVLDIFWSRLRNGNDVLGDYVNFWIYNYVQGNFTQFYTGEDYTPGFIRRQLEISGINFSQYIQNSSVIIKINDTIIASLDNKDTIFKADYMELDVLVDVVNATVDNIRGSGEFNVKKSFSPPEPPLSFDVNAIIFFIALIILGICLFSESPIVAVAGGLALLFGGIWYVITTGPALGLLISILGVVVLFVKGSEY